MTMPTRNTRINLSLVNRSESSSSSSSPDWTTYDNDDYYDDDNECTGPEYPLVVLSPRFVDSGANVLSWIGDSRVAVSSIQTASTLDTLQRAGITHVVTCTGDNFFPHHFGYCTLDFEDDDSVELLDSVVPAAVRYIACVLHASPANRVLVHCKGGRSRSVSIVVAMLMCFYNYTYDAALATVQHYRPVAQPNDSFAAQLGSCTPHGLRTYIEQHNDVNAAAMLHTFAMGVVVTRPSTTDMGVVVARPTPA